MRGFSNAKYMAVASVLLPGAALLIWPAKVWLAAVFIVWLGTAAWYWLTVERKEHEQNIARTIEAMQKAGIRTLNHHRHDWMNDLQVLYGYIRLQKLDKTIEYVEKIRDHMNAESDIAKLGEPALVSYIQSFRTLTNTLELQVHIKGNVHLNELALDQAKVAESIIQTINAYRLSVMPSQGSPAQLILELSVDDGALYAAFYYKGQLINEQQWQQKINEQLKDALMKPVRMEHSYTNMLLKADMRV